MNCKHLRPGSEKLKRTSTNAPKSRMRTTRPLWMEYRGGSGPAGEIRTNGHQFALHTSHSAAGHTSSSTNHHACLPTYKVCLVRHHDVGDPLRPPPGTCFAAEAALRETWRQNHPDTEAANECGPPMLLLLHTAHNEVHHGRCGIMNCEAAARYSFVWPCLQGYGPAGQPFWSAESPGHGYKEGANPRQHVALP